MFNASRKFLFLALVVMCAFLHPLQAHAAPGCDSQGGDYSADGNVLMPRDMPIGDTTTETLATGYAYSLMCGSDDTAEHDIWFKITIDAAPVAGFTDVYPTDIPGLGVRFHFHDDTDFCDIRHGDTIENSSREFKCHLSTSNQPLSSLASSIEFVKTADGQYGGRVKKVPLVKSSYRVDSNPVETQLNTIWSGQISVTLEVSACSLSNYTASVALGDVSDSSFTGVGSTPGTKAFTVGMNCSFGVNIHVTLHGTQNADTSDNSVLALTNASGSGVAGGVGVQILHDDTPLKLGENIKVATSFGGHEDLAFAARYFQTKSSVDAGTADTTATLEITYQ